MYSTKQLGQVPTRRFDGGVGVGGGGCGGCAIIRFLIKSRGCGGSGFVGIVMVVVVMVLYWW